MVCKKAPPTPLKKFEITFWFEPSYLRYKRTEQQTHFRLSLLSQQKIEGEVTTGNASAVRRLLKEMQSSKFGNV